MHMQEIASKIERKQLLDKLELLERLKSGGQETVTREEILRLIEAREKELLEEIRYYEKKEKDLIGGGYNITAIRVMDLGL